MSSQLEQLRELSAVVADTGDIEAIARFRPMDATTNPSLLLKAASLPAYAHFIDDAAAKAAGQGEARLGDACDRLAGAGGGGSGRGPVHPASRSAESRRKRLIAAEAGKERREINSRITITIAGHLHGGAATAWHGCPRRSRSARRRR